MSDRGTPVLKTMARMWLPPATDGPDYSAARNKTVPAADVYEALLSKFGEERVRADVTRFLENMCAAYESAQWQDSIERAFADCALALVTEDGGLHVSPELAARIVRSFPPAIWHFPVGLLIARYLGFVPLVETLLEGITNPPHPGALEDALTGFRLYLGKARTDEEARAQAPVVQALARIDELAASADTEISRLAQKARTALENRMAVPS